MGKSLLQQRIEKQPDAAGIRSWYDAFYSREGPYHEPSHFNRKGLELLELHKSPGATMLDLGCGSGELLAAAGSSVESYGIDISGVILEEAKKRCPRARLVVGQAEGLPFKDESFDIVVCSGSLEHFLEMDRALSEMRRVLKPGGRVLLSVPNAFWISHVLNVMLTGKYPSQGQLWEFFATRLGWEAILEPYFSIERVEPINLSPFAPRSDHYRLHFRPFSLEHGIRSLLRSWAHFVLFTLALLLVPRNLSYHFWILGRKG